MPDAKPLEEARELVARWKRHYPNDYQVNTMQKCAEDMLVAIIADALVDATISTQT